MRSKKANKSAFYIAIINAVVIALTGWLVFELNDQTIGFIVSLIIALLTLLLNYWLIRYLYRNIRQTENTEQIKMESYRKEFLGNVSHELKTPIFNILGFVETLLDGGIEDKSINRKYLRKAEKNIQRLIAIIEDLDKISRFETDQIELEKEEFDIRIVILEVIEALEISAKTYQIDVKLDSGFADSLLVFADRDKIYQVLTNLIFNSIKYGKEGGQSIISYKIINGQAEISVVDDGIGIDPNHIPRLFERFYRVDTNRSRKHGGTGLGLAIVKHIMEAHELPIHVESVLGQGTSFRFQLDIKKTSTK